MSEMSGMTGDDVFCQRAAIDLQLSSRLVVDWPTGPLVVNLCLGCLGTTFSVDVVVDVDLVVDWSTGPLVVDL